MAELTKKARRRARRSYNATRRACWCRSLRWSDVQRIATPSFLAQCARRHPSAVWVPMPNVVAGEHANLPLPADHPSGFARAGLVSR